MKILNLTQHNATPEQAGAGVVDLQGEWAENARADLTFHDMPGAEELAERAENLACIALRHAADAAMIGGAPYLMAPLEAELKRRGIRPLYAFSRRDSVEQVQPDGSTRKINVFRHEGFVG